MRSILRTAFIGGAAYCLTSFAPSEASACGGFFCNQSQPVNQAAEGIIFADNGDGTVTAVIEIQYQGPSTSFSWLLPISSVSIADIGVASELALQRLQRATNPLYTLNTKVEGTCKQDSQRNSTPSVGGSTSAPGSNQSSGDNGTGVTVAASGSVGPYDIKVIKFDASLAEPADAAVSWLTMNGYDVPDGAAKLLGPYLQSGLELLALKLTKGADVGSIRPIVLTYPGTQASIPIKLTAVAANPDMGVLTWVLGPSRAVPENYLSLELNEARLNWFNASSNYNAVTIEAANDADGHGFVTEFAGPSTKLKGLVWTPEDDANWSSFKGALYQSFSDFFSQAYARYGQYDGFWDATQASVTLPANVQFEDFKLCPNCYANQIQIGSLSVYLDELQKSVIEPMKLVQNLVDAHPEITRMYTTLSADEMTLDPLFTFNSTLPEVSNLHTADRVIECNAGVSQFEAPWRIELPQGGVVRGTSAQVGSWPSDLSSLPSNQRVLQAAQTGAGKVIEDNTSVTALALTSYNAQVPGAPASSASGGCSVIAPGRAPFSAFLVLSASLALVLGRRRRVSAID
jgi:RNAse (barnase) inhibitor barstar